MIEILHIVVAMKPLKSKNFVESAVSDGLAGINVDECRVVSGSDYKDGGACFTESAMAYMGSHQTRPWVQQAIREGKPVKVSKAHCLGRFPANVIHDGSDGVVGGFPATKSGNLLPNHKRHTDGGNGNTSGKMKGIIGITRDGDSGSAARFFKECPKDV